MASEVLAEAALLAFYSTAEAVTIVLFGVGARWMGYLDGNINGRLSRFCMRLTNPVLCLSLYSFFSASKLARWWPVPIVATLHIALGALLGRLAGALLRLQPPHRQILVMSVGFANCGAIPFVLVVPLFLQWSRTKDDPQALGDAFSVSGATACGCHSPPCATDTPMLSLDPARSAALPAPPGDPAAIRSAGDWPVSVGVDSSLLLRGPRHCIFSQAVCQRDPLRHRPGVDARPCGSRDVLAKRCCARLRQPRLPSRFERAARYVRRDGVQRFAAVHASGGRRRVDYRRPQPGLHLDRARDWLHQPPEGRAAGRRAAVDGKRLGPARQDQRRSFHHSLGLGAAAGR